MNGQSAEAFRDAIDRVAIDYPTRPTKAACAGSSLLFDDEQSLSER